MRQKTALQNPNQESVSIHAPAWGATLAERLGLGLALAFQSTHPRGVRPTFDTFTAMWGIVSIHAPAWGATNKTPGARNLLNRFQSTHPRGVRLRWLRRHHPKTPFQSTHPRGVRRSAGGAWSVGRRGVSIHAPAWGATGTTSRYAILRNLFQSTHPRGVRRAGGRHGADRCAKFQSTHPRGVRRQDSGASSMADRFQSTHPRGVRLPLRTVNSVSQFVSIHAPAWGATKTRRENVETICSFNQRTRVGCDNRGEIVLAPRTDVSIHAPAWGATRSG